MGKRYQHAILVSCEIPWDENFRFMEDAFRDEVKACREMGYNDLYIFGTAGEGYAVKFSKLASSRTMEAVISQQAPYITLKTDRPTVDYVLSPLRVRSI